MNKNLLPRVSIEISASLEHELTGKKDAAYIKQQLKIIQKENPVLYFWIKSFSKKTKDKKGAAFCGIMVFKLLRIQAECDRMETEIKLI